jgi:hypothetical protein
MCPRVIHIASTAFMLKFYHKTPRTKAGRSLKSGNAGSDLIGLFVGTNVVFVGTSVT